jgi:hypothetical protein
LGKAPPCLRRPAPHCGATAFYPTRCARPDPRGLNEDSDASYAAEFALRNARPWRAACA